MRYLTATEAALRIGVSEKTVRIWVKEGKLKALHPAKNRLAIAEQDVERLAQERRLYYGPGTPTNVRILPGDNDSLLSKITSLENKITEQEHRIADLENTIAKLAKTKPSESVDIAQNKPVSGAMARDTSMSVRRPGSANVEAKNIALPDGCLLATDFGLRHGVPRETFRAHMLFGIGAGLIHGPDVPEDGTVLVKDYVRAEERNKRVRKDGTIEKERYLTREQQAAALEFWKRHGVSFSQCERPECPCHHTEAGCPCL